MIAHLEAQGSLLKLKLKGRQSDIPRGGGRRGIIRVFSRQSRVRLMRFLARLKTRKIRATFITLTFTEVVSNERAKKVFKRFVMRLRRKFSLASAVWRMEFQKRGAIHFHMLAFNLPFWKQAELQETWEDCTEENRSVVDIRLVHGARSVMSYISKYIAKVDDRTEITSLEDDTYQHAAGEKLSGRFWGYINREGLPLGQLVAGVLTDRKVIKSLSSFAWAIMGAENPYNNLSFSLFCDNARWLFERAIEEGGCLYEEWEYSIKDHTSIKPTYNPYTDIFSDSDLELNPVPVIGRVSRPSEASEVQPCTRDWTARAFFSGRCQ